MNPKQLLRLEGTAVFVFSLFSYHWNQGSWLKFALLFLIPDVSMVGYLVNVRAGANVYNAVHTYVGPIVLAAYSLGTGRHAPLLLSLIWIAHLGFDRMLGFGLKYPTRFDDTHFNPYRHRTAHGDLIDKRS